MQRTTLRIDPELFAEVKRLAHASGCTVTRFVEDALRTAVARKLRGGTPGVTLPRTIPGWGLAPGVDLDDSAALLDQMERGSASE